MKTILLLATLGSLAACSSGTTIRVSDPAARIYVNGEYIGTGHAHYSDRKPAFSRQEVTVRRTGCAEETYTMRRNERPDIGAIISAYYLVVPIAWFIQYKDHHAYEYDCELEQLDHAGEDV